MPLARHLGGRPSCGCSGAERFFCPCFQVEETSRIRRSPEQKDRVDTRPKRRLSATPPPTRHRLRTLALALSDRPPGAPAPPATRAGGTPSLTLSATPQVSALPGASAAVGVPCPGRAQQAPALPHSPLATRLRRSAPRPAAMPVVRSRTLIYESSPSTHLSSALR